MNQTWEFVTAASTTALHGLYAEVSDKCAVHFHGSWGNFYENPFALGVHGSYTTNGIGYASVNCVGHDGGTVDEDLDRALDDIEVWLSYFEHRGVRQFVLQGHSLGALKVIRALSTDLAKRHEIAGAVLLSPFDLPAFYAQTGDSSQIDAKHNSAVDLSQILGVRAMAPSDMFDIWPISLGTYASATARGGYLDVFRTRADDLAELAATNIASLTVLGGGDFAATPNNDHVRSLVADIPQSDSVFVPGAPHNFAGFESAVYLAIAEFARAIRF